MHKKRDGKAVQGAKRPMLLGLVKCDLHANIMRIKYAHLKYSFKGIPMQPLFDSSAPKKPTNLSINSDLLRAAKELNINISATLEHTLIELVKQKAKEKWLQDNQQAIESYNQHVDDNGVFSDEFRSF